MRIVYVARHGSGDNDPEGAIAFALTQLGHEVIRLTEHRGKEALRINADLCLFHKWEDALTIARIKIPKALWYFDLVDAGVSDLGTLHRSVARVAWMNSMAPIVDHAFLTDGDFVRANRAKWLEKGLGKLNWLMQGVDVRVAGPGVATDKEQIPILFVGSLFHKATQHTPYRYGARRLAWGTMMQKRYGDDFHVVGDGPVGRRVVQRDLADVIASSRIVVAPDGPQTDYYWSNRVYLTLGFAGFMLHPYCKGLTRHYTDKKEVVYYCSDEELHDLIDHYSLSRTAAADRAEIREQGFRRTMTEHTYIHRCKELLDVVAASSSSLLPRSAPLSIQGSKVATMPANHKVLIVGCGNRPRGGAVNLDVCLLPGVDVVHDLDSFPYPFEDESFDSIEAEDVLEHVVHFVAVVNELGRILKKGGKLWVRGPHCNYPEQVWADPTHLRAFAPRTFDNFDPDTRDGKLYGHYFGTVKFKVLERREVNKGMEYLLEKR